MMTGSVMMGNCEVGRIECGPDPGMLNLMAWIPGPALASKIACRNEPAPLSLTLVTVKEGSLTTVKAKLFNPVRVAGDVGGKPAPPVTTFRTVDWPTLPPGTDAACSKVAPTAVSHTLT